MDIQKLLKEKAESLVVELSEWARQNGITEVGRGISAKISFNHDAITKIECDSEDTELFDDKVWASLEAIPWSDYKNGADCLEFIQGIRASKNWCKRFNFDQYEIQARTNQIFAQRRMPFKVYIAEQGYQDERPGIYAIKRIA